MMDADTAGLEVDLTCAVQDWRTLESSAGSLGVLARDLGHRVYAATGRYGEMACEAAIRLTDDAEMADLNRRFRNREGPTNVLSFPDGTVTQGTLRLGDIALGFETVAREAHGQAKPLAHHTCHLIIHGLLHLFGFDHEGETEAEIMEAMECRLLADLSIPNPYTMR